MKKENQQHGEQCQIEKAFLPETIFLLAGQYLRIYRGHTKPPHTFFLNMKNLLATKLTSVTAKSEFNFIKSPFQSQQSLQTYMIPTSRTLIPKRHPPNRTIFSSTRANRNRHPIPSSATGDHQVSLPHQEKDSRMNPTRIDHPPSSNTSAKALDSVDDKILQASRRITEHLVSPCTNEKIIPLQQIVSSFLFLMNLDPRKKET